MAGGLVPVVVPAQAEIMARPLGLLPELGTTETIEKLELIERFDLGFLAPKLTPQLTYGWLQESEAPLAISDLKRFMALFALFPGEQLSPSNKVDMAWHSFILFTRHYREFCNVVFGGYIDHYPDPPGAARDVARQQRTLSRYRQAFGAPSELIWGIGLRPAQAPPSRPVWPFAGAAVSLAVLAGVLLLPRAAR